MENEDVSLYNNGEIIYPVEDDSNTVSKRIEIFSDLAKDGISLLNTHEQTKQLTEKLKVASQMISAHAKIGQEVIDASYKKHMREMDNLEKVLNHAIETNDTKLMTNVMEQMSLITGMSIAQEYNNINNRSSNNIETTNTDELPWGDL